jgi:hypothetical protein
MKTREVLQRSGQSFPNCDSVSYGFETGHALGDLGGKEHFQE